MGSSVTLLYRLSQRGKVRQMAFLQLRKRINLLCSSPDGTGKLEQLGTAVLLSKTQGRDKNPGVSGQSEPRDMRGTSREAE